MTDVSAALCASCGAPQLGRFCERCGEKRVSAHDYSIAHFAEHVVEGLTHFDLRSLRALNALVLIPGALTRSYLDGRRKGYVGPIQLFLILNVVFALIGPTTFRTPLNVQENDPPFPAMKRAMVADAIAHGKLEREEFRRGFDSNAGTQAKTWIFLTIPMFALCLAALYGFGRYYFEHLVFATHFMAFFLLVAIAVRWGTELALRLAGTRLSAQGYDFVTSAVDMAALLVYLFVALRRTYGDGRFAAALRSLSLGALFLPTLLTYRFVLFFITLKTMH